MSTANLSQDQIRQIAFLAMLEAKEDDIQLSLFDKTLGVERLT